MLSAGCATKPPPAAPVASGDTFSFDVPENRFRVVIPEMPQIKMTPHPLAASRPDARYLGGDEKSGYTISILTPTADKGMTPEDCASSSYRGLLKRYGVEEKYVVARRNNPTTFVVLFPTRAGPLLQLKAYLLSGYNGDHCIDVHVSRNFNVDGGEQLAKDMKEWFESFTKASIEHY
jgi:hypothetical protein